MRRAAWCVFLFYVFSSWNKGCILWFRNYCSPPYSLGAKSRVTCTPNEANIQHLSNSFRPPIPCISFGYGWTVIAAKMIWIFFGLRNPTAHASVCSLCKTNVQNHAKVFSRDAQNAKATGKLSALLMFCDLHWQQILCEWWINTFGCLWTAHNYGKRVKHGFPFWATLVACLLF